MTRGPCVNCFPLLTVILIKDSLSFCVLIGQKKQFEDSISTHRDEQQYFIFTFERLIINQVTVKSNGNIYPESSESKRGFSMRQPIALCSQLKMYKKKGQPGKMHLTPSVPPQSSSKLKVMKNIVDIQIQIQTIICTTAKS